MTQTGDSEGSDAAGEAPRATPSPKFQALRNNSPHLAAGITMSLLMGHAPFADRTFGGMCRLIAGHLNRKHYYIVFRDGQPRGFVGWTYDQEDAAQAWLDGNGTLTGDGREGDCVIFNFWVTDGPDMNSFLVRTMREEFRDKRRLVARRIYSDGRIRPISIANTRI
ncbi:hypothetical protein ATO11_18340 [Pseudaestuariivita atlantica]|uniref:Toxin-activating lysine-acyltransferase n=2 Tax=Pseudaestuariivita atlantica TaxID=1317121 RepID=A0A0L1JKH9_9RHOB|nr:hypothetical protein ATO11_18340 [Pseudaestuariivita atlantica]